MRKRLLNSLLAFMFVFAIVFCVKETAYAFDGEVLYKKELKATTVMDSATNVSENISLTPYSSWSIFPLKIEDSAPCSGRYSTPEREDIPG